jgi:uncharacterized protein YoxC
MSKKKKNIEQVIPRIEDRKKELKESMELLSYTIVTLSDTIQDAIEQLGDVNACMKLIEKLEKKEKKKPTKKK